MKAFFVFAIGLLLSYSSFSERMVKKLFYRTKNIVTRTVLKQGVKKSIPVFSESVTKNMTKDVLSLFAQGNYRQITGIFKNQRKAILVSPKFDKFLKIERSFTGNFDPVSFHKGDPRYVIDGCETNLGRMRRGLAPLYKDPNNVKPDWHGYSAFELHHGGQKANPDYFAIMADDHKTASSILHPSRKNSQINRAEFAAKERAPLYKDLAKSMYFGF